MRHKTLWIALIVTLAATLFWLAFVWAPEPREGVLLAAPEPPAGGEFVLQSPAGRLALSSYRGKVVLIYFGYTFCPDVCPTSLARMAQALSGLTAGELAQVAGLFISLDPERDTPQVLQAYAPFFHPAIVGLTGTSEQIAEVARQYGVRYMKQPSAGGAPYLIDHSSSIYAIARDGKIAAVLPHGSTPQRLIDILRALLADDKTG